MKRLSPMIWLGIALMIIGVLIDVLTTSYVIGTVLIVVGVLIVAMGAGKGRKGGGELDH